MQRATCWPAVHAGLGVAGVNLASPAWPAKTDLPMAGHGANPRLGWGSNPCLGWGVSPCFNLGC